MSLAFLITSLVVIASPGTGALYTVSVGLLRGRRAGIVAALGCALGIVPHLAAAITGAAALLRASGIAFETVKVLGVVYLLYMAWATWRDGSPIVVQDGRPAASMSRVITSAVLVNLLNPKLTIFFFALLPQFVPADGPNQLATMLWLGAVFMLMTFGIFALYGLFAATARRHLVDRPRVVIRIRKAFAATFVALGAKLAVTTQ